MATAGATFMKFGVNPLYNPGTPSFLKISLMRDVMVPGWADIVPPEFAVTTARREKKGYTKRFLVSQLKDIYIQKGLQTLSL